MIRAAALRIEHPAGDYVNSLDTAAHHDVPLGFNCFGMEIELPNTALPCSRRISVSGPFKRRSPGWVRAVFENRTQIKRPPQHLFSENVRDTSAARFHRSTSRSGLIIIVATGLASARIQPVPFLMMSCCTSFCLLMSRSNANIPARPPITMRLRDTSAVISGPWRDERSIRIAGAPRAEPAAIVPAEWW